MCLEPCFFEVGFGSVFNMRGFVVFSVSCCSAQQNASLQHSEIMLGGNFSYSFQRVGTELAAITLHYLATLIDFRMDQREKRQRMQLCFFDVRRPVI